MLYQKVIFIRILKIEDHNFLIIFKNKIKTKFNLLLMLLMILCSDNEIINKNNKQTKCIW